MSLILFTQRYVFIRKMQLYFIKYLYFSATTSLLIRKFTQSKSLPLPFFNDLIIINNAISFIFMPYVYQYAYLSHVFIIDIRPIKLYTN